MWRRTILWLPPASAKVPSSAHQNWTIFGQNQSLFYRRNQFDGEMNMGCIFQQKPKDFRVFRTSWSCRSLIRLHLAVASQCTSRIWEALSWVWPGTVTTMILRSWGGFQPKASICQGPTPNLYRLRNEHISHQTGKGKTSSKLTFSGDTC